MVGEKPSEDSGVCFSNCLHPAKLNRNASWILSKYIPIPFPKYVRWEGKCVRLWWWAFVSLTHSSPRLTCQVNSSLGTHSLTSFNWQLRSISADRCAADTLKTTEGEKLTRGSEALRQGWQGLLSMNKGDEHCRRYYGLAAFSERSAASFYNCFHSFQYSLLEHSKARSCLKVDP